MFMTMSVEGPGATDLGYLMHKHPGRKAPQSFEHAHGTAHVWYPQRSEEHTTIALWLDASPRKMRRGGPGKGPGTLVEYVNSSAYVAGGAFVQAMKDTLRSAINGECAARPDLVERRWAMRCEVSAVRAEDDGSLAWRMFSPLGYEVSIGEGQDAGSYGRLCLVHPGQTVGVALRQLYVLLAAMDSGWERYVGETEVDVLTRRGGGWLEEHPERGWITGRFLKRQKTLMETALERLGVGEGNTARDRDPIPKMRESLQALRIETAARRVIEAGAKQIADLGCGEGKLARRLAEEDCVEGVTAVDVSSKALSRARRHAGQQGARSAGKIRFAHAPIGVRGGSWSHGHDAAVLLETIEHIDPERIAEVEDAVFGGRGYRIVVISTPNREYNTLYEGLGAGKLRHRDHRFEWDRAEMEAWCTGVAKRHGYDIAIEGVGDEDPVHGPPTQLAVFERIDEAENDAEAGQKGTEQ